MITRTNGLLTDESRKVLSRLLGQNIFMLYTRSVHIRRNYFGIPDISFALPNKLCSESFLVVRPVWEEDEDLADFGWLEIVTSGTPEKIRYDHGSPAQVGSIDLCSTIDLTPASPICRVTLLSKNLWSVDASMEESWPYHFAILFEHEERFKYMISYRPDPMCQLKFTFDEDEIECVRKSAESEEVLENTYST